MKFLVEMEQELFESMQEKIEHDECKVETVIDGQYTLVTNDKGVEGLRSTSRVTKGYIDEKHNMLNAVYFPTGKDEISKEGHETYEDIMWALCDQYVGMLGHLNPKKIAIIEDHHWELKEASNHNTSWKGQTKKANGVYALLGYDYVITLRRFYTAGMHRTQIKLLLMALMSLIDKNLGNVKNIRIDDENVFVMTFGSDCFSPSNPVRDVIEDPLSEEEWAKYESQMNLWTTYAENKKAAESGEEDGKEG